MPLVISSNLTQDSRRERVKSDDDFFHLAHSVDVDFSVDLINNGLADDIPPQIYGRKTIIKNASNSKITIMDLQNNDIVMWDGDEWIIYMRVNNPQSNNSVVYDKRTQKFYKYSPSDGWVALLDSKSTIDGGTF